METSIIVAIIAGFVSFIGLVITKEQKISEFRQAWIEALRNDVAELMSTINHFELAYLTYKKQNRGKLAHDFIDENIEITNKIQLMIHKINLRLNPNDSEGLIKELNKLNKILISPSEMIKDNNLENATNQFTEKAHTILKNEWERVKKGEPWFRFTKWGIVVLFFIGFIIFVGSIEVVNSKKDNQISTLQKESNQLNHQKAIVNKKVIESNIKTNESNVSTK
ncbi:MAG TPA: hypothetical protein CFH82_03680 [Sulfurospirillum sp. UBA12182]|nr:MAG TPA: hypothetical protein CFH82_03680 [Sulfurospirillum sp. UBA12182]